MRTLKHNWIISLTELALVNKAITENLEEGEKLNSEMKSVEYYKDFPLNNKSMREGHD